MKNPIKRGFYKHYKGNIYEVIGVASHSETLEELVVYKGVRGDLWARPALMWNDLIETNQGLVTRFQYIGESYSEMRN